MGTLKKQGIHFIDLKTLAEIKSISIYTLRKCAKHGGMPHHRIGRKIIVDPLAFDKWFINKDSESIADTAKTVDDILEEVLHEIA